MPDLFARAIEEIAADSPDLFVLSGDLLDYPLDGMDDPFLKDQAEKDLSLIAHLLERLACPKTLVFGNHDHPALFRYAFDSLPMDQEVDGLRVLSFLDAEGPGNVPVREESERRRFADALSDPATPPQIHVQHYLVWPKRNEDYPHTYGAGDSMRRAIIASGNVRLVLSGHYHRGVAPAFDKGVWFATVPAFVEPPHPYWVYDLCGGEFNWTQKELGVSLPYA